MKTFKGFQAGFTTIEVVVALIIVFLLISVAVVSFQDHRTRQARAEARQALLESAHWLKQQPMPDGGYGAHALPYPQTPRGGDARYRIDFVRQPVVASDPPLTFAATDAETFTLRADPVDADGCGSLLLDSAGRRGVTGAGASVADCWR